MKSPQKIPVSYAAFAALFFVTAAPILADEAKEMQASLKADDGKCVSTAASGGLELVAKADATRTTFSVIDSNGGELKDGDEIKIKYTPGKSADAGKNKPSYWHEGSGQINRVNEEPQDGSGKFKLVKQGDGFALQTASGKFASSPAGAGGLGLTDTAGSALVFTIQESAK